MKRVLLLGIGLLSFVLFGGATAAERLAAGSAASRVPQGEFPARLQWARDNPNRRPPPEVRRDVRTEDKEWLIQAYRSQPKANQRIAIVWLLACVGDDEVFRLFSEALRFGPGAQTLDEGSVGVFTELLHGMGVMAQTNDLAFQFLTEAINPDWWRKERKWRVTSEQPGENESLAWMSVEVLGLSARSEAGVMLDRIKRESAGYVPPKDPRENWAPGSNVYTAKRYLEVSRKMGRQAFRDGLFGSEFKRYSLEWRRSEEGMKWLEWWIPRDQLPELWRDVEKFFENSERDR